MKENFGNFWKCGFCYFRTKSYPHTFAKNLHTQFSYFCLVFMWPAIGFQWIACTTLIFSSVAKIGRSLLIFLVQSRGFCFRGH